MYLKQIITLRSQPGNKSKGRLTGIYVYRGMPAHEIPKRFKLFAQTIDVVFTDDPFIEEPEACGFSSYRLNQIQLRKHPERTPEQVSETFWHELVHFLVYFSGPSRDREITHMFQDENFVDLTAQLLHQAVESFEYE